MSGGAKVNNMEKNCGKEETKKPRVSIPGVPINEGQPKVGPEVSPAEFRKRGLVKLLHDLDYDVVDYGDVTIRKVENDPNFGFVRHSRTMAASTLETADRVEECLRQQSQCLALGGDHSVSSGTILGHVRVKPDVVVLGSTRTQTSTLH